MKRVLCIVILFSVIFSCASCQSGTQDDDSSRKLSLSVEEINATYSGEAQNAFRESFLVSAEKILYKSEGFALQESEKQKLVSYIDETLFPLLISLNVYAYELESLHKSIASFAENYEKTDILSVYTALSALLGNERSAALTYEFTLLYLRYLRDDFAKKHEQTNYPWHLAEKEKCDQMITELENALGKDKFAAALELFAFCASLSRGMLLSESSGGGIYKISGGELCMLLRRHAKALSNKKITDTEWNISARIAEYIARRKLHLSDPVQNATSLALISKSFFEGVSGASNELISLYASFAENISDEHCKLLIDGTKNEKATSVCITLLSCRDELVSFLSALEQGAIRDTEVGRSELTALGLAEKYGEFVKSTPPISADDLIRAIEGYANGEESLSSLDTEFISYLYGISPCLAFSVSNGLASEK